MFRSAFLLAAICLAAPAIAKPAEQIVVADNSAVCGPARLAYHKAADNERAARRLAAKIEREQGVATRVIVLHPGMLIGNINRTGASPAPIYLNNPC